MQSSNCLAIHVNCKPSGKLWRLHKKKPFSDSAWFQPALSAIWQCKHSSISSKISATEVLNASALLQVKLKFHITLPSFHAFKKTGTQPQKDSTAVRSPGWYEVQKQIKPCPPWSLKLVFIIVYLLILSIWNEAKFEPVHLMTPKTFSFCGHLLLRWPNSSTVRALASFALASVAKTSRQIKQALMSMTPKTCELICTNFIASWVQMRTLPSLFGPQRCTRLCAVIHAPRTKTSEKTGALTFFHNFRFPLFVHSTLSLDLTKLTFPFTFSDTSQERRVCTAKPAHWSKWLNLPAMEVVEEHPANVHKAKENSRSCIQNRREITPKTR